MPGADRRNDADHIRPALLSPEVVLLDGAEQAPRPGKSKQSSDPADTLLELGTSARGFTFDARGSIRLQRPVVADVHLDRFEEGGRVLAEPRQRPISFVQASMSVAVEELAECRAEGRSGQRFPRLSEIIVAPEPIGDVRLLPRGLRKGDEIEGLLRADRSLASRQM